MFNKNKNVKALWKTLNLVLFLPNSVFSIKFLDYILMVSLNFNNQKHI